MMIDYHWTSLLGQQTRNFSEVDELLQNGDCYISIFTSTRYRNDLRVHWPHFKTPILSNYQSHSIDRFEEINKNAAVKDLRLVGNTNYYIKLTKYQLTIKFNSLINNTSQQNNLHTFVCN